MKASARKKDDQLNKIIGEMAADVANGDEGDDENDLLALMDKL